MNISIIGASGFVGSAILKEAINRGHQVTAIARDTSKINETSDGLRLQNVDINQTNSLAEAVKDSDVVISAFNAGWTNPNIYEDFITGSKAIQEAVKESGVKRLIVIGGAGSLYAAPGVQLVDTPEFPKEYYPGASAARDYFNILKEEKNIDWTFFSPAIEMHHGIDTGRTGKYRTGLDNPVFDENGRSILSVQDLAVAIVDEAEQANHVQQRFTAAY
jgi:uncharacterized protein